MKTEAPPRIYCIPATESPVVAVFRRGPTRWSHVGRWDVSAGRYEPGAWLRARIFPRRSDVSPDGRFLCYFAHQPGAAWEHGEAYVAISKLPWLTALHAFGTCGTWTRGYYFTESYVGAKLPIPSLSAVPAVQFAIERRRGWSETADCPIRDPGDAWDERRNARLEKRQPRGDRVLRVESLGWAGGESGVEQAVDGLRAAYWMERNDDLEALDDVQWADWDREGRLLVATRAGTLQIRDLTGGGVRVAFEEDLSVLEPNPSPPPSWARQW